MFSLLSAWVVLQPIALHDLTLFLSALSDVILLEGYRFDVKGLAARTFG
jgi:hypothetical protein